MKQFKILIAFIFLFTQNVYAYEGFDGSADAVLPQCTKTVEEVRSELSQIQVGSEKNINTLFDMDAKNTKLNGILPCLEANGFDVQSLRDQSDSLGKELKVRESVVLGYELEDESTSADKKTATAASTSATNDESAKKTAAAKSTSQTPTGAQSSTPVATPNAALPVTQNASATKPDPQLPASSPTAATDPKASVPATTPVIAPAPTAPASAQVALTTPEKLAPAVAAEKAKPTVEEQKEKDTKEAPTLPKKNADTVAAIPAKPAASSDINIGAIAKIGLMAAAAWIYVKQITKAFKKKDEETAAGRSTASSGSGSSSSSSKDGKQSPGDYKNASYSGNIKAVPGVFGDGSWPTGDSTLLVEHPDIYGYDYGLGGTFEFSIAADGKVSGMFTLWGTPCPISGGQLPNGGTEVTVILPGSTAVIRFSGAEVSGYVYEPGPAGHGWETHKRGNLKGHRK